MPCHKQITVTLVSKQGDDVALPEYNPPLDIHEIIDPDVPIGTDDENFEVIVYVPAQSNSQFWIEYSVARPYQPNEAWFFKLFVDETHVVSWVCDATNGYKGRMRYGLFDAENGRRGAEGIEKRILKFGETVLSNAEEEDVKPERAVEVKVYRIWDKIMAQVGIPIVEKNFGNGLDGRIGLVQAGPLARGHSLNQYQVRLVDPLDKPYVNFRFLYRSLKELNDLGINTNQSDASSASAQKNLPSLTNPNGSLTLKECQREAPLYTAPTTLRSCIRHPSLASTSFVLRVNPPRPSSSNSLSSDDSPIRIPRSVASGPSASSQPRSEADARRATPAIGNASRMNFQQRIAALVSNENSLRAPSASLRISPSPERQLRPKDSLGILRGIKKKDEKEDNDDS